MEPLAHRHRPGGAHQHALLRVARRPAADGRLRHGAVLAFIAALVFLATQRHQEFLLFNTDRFRYKELLASISPEQVVVVGLVLGFFLGEQLVHYYCDRCLFRFRNPGIRRRVAPLLLEDTAPR